MIEKISVSGRDRTWDCYISRPALNPLSYIGFSQNVEGTQVAW